MKCHRQADGEYILEPLRVAAVSRQQLHPRPRPLSRRLRGAPSIETCASNGLISDDIGVEGDSHGSVFNLTRVSILNEASDVIGRGDGHLDLNHDSDYFSSPPLIITGRYNQPREGLRSDHFETLSPSRGNYSPAASLPQISPYSSPVSPWGPREDTKMPPSGIVHDKAIPLLALHDVNFLNRHRGLIFAAGPAALTLQQIRKQNLIRNSFEEYSLLLHGSKFNSRRIQHRKFQRSLSHELR